MRSRSSPWSSRTVTGYVSVPRSTVPWPAVVYEREGRALEVAADTAAVCAELRDDLVVPVVRFQHLSLLVCSPVSGASVLPDGRFVDVRSTTTSRSWANGSASRFQLHDVVGVMHVGRRPELALPCDQLSGAVGAQSSAFWCDFSRRTGPFVPSS